MSETPRDEQQWHHPPDYYYYIQGLFIVVFSRCEDVTKDRNTKNNLIWTAENGDPIHEACIPPGSLAHGNNEDEARGRSRNKIIAR